MRQGEGISGALRAVKDRAALAPIVLAVLVLAHVAYYFPRVVDDVFISLRYAENVVRGHGAVYNAGERVEGFSSPAWLFVQTLGIACGFEPVTFTKIIGVGCLFATAFGARALMREVYGVRGWPSWIPAFACAANVYLVAWTVLGLETPLHIAMLVLAPLAMSRALADGSVPRRTRLLAVLALVALGTSRPESPLYVMANVIAPFASARSRSDVVRIARRAWPIVVAAGVILVGLLATRLAYYGELFPNTYRVKGQHTAFELGKLAALWRQGASPLEAFELCGGTLLLLWFSWRRRAIAPALSALLCLYFTAKVAVDWMPSLRHLLPITVLAPIGWASLVAELDGAPIRSRITSWFLVVTALSIATIDVRLSPIEHRSTWIVRKSRAKWSDTWLAYRRIEPPHVTQMNGYDMGQISQAWPVLETSDAPVEASWYAARDVGAVGFYTGVKVFDTAGLVTSAVSRSEAWTARGDVPDELVHLMMAKRPVSGDVFDGWDDALGRNPALMIGYRLRIGPEQSPSGWTATDRLPPSRAEVLRRYRAFAAKLPRLYHLHTLYGESMGAAALKRLRLVEAGDPPVR